MAASTCETLSDLTERLAVAAAQADAEDLPSLAELHTRFVAVVEATGGLPDAVRPALREAADAARTLEQIILREIDDADAALSAARETARQLLDLVHGCTIPPEQAPHPEDRELIDDFTGEAISHLEAADASVAALAEDPHDAEAVAAVFRSFHTIKGVAGFLNFRQIGALAHAAESLLDLARQGRIELSGGRMQLVLESIDAMKSLVEDVGLSARTNLPPNVAPLLPALLARLQACVARPGDSPAGATRARPAPAAQPAAERTVKVAIDRLDRLTTTVAALVMAQATVAQDVAAAVPHGHRRLNRNMARLAQVTRELRDLSMSMRMVPIQGLFHAMARVVQDVAQKLDKEVTYAYCGGDTEVDRRVLDAVGDSLVHMVRNSVDHGIEPSTDRAAAGKPPAGRIELRAVPQPGGEVVVEVVDDGRGLNRARLFAKAREAGIPVPDAPSDQDVFKLIFHPGLSTAERVTDISGRGVGMDVVKANVEAIGGRIDIASTEGRGTTFTLRLPSGAAAGHLS